MQHNKRQSILRKLIFIFGLLTAVLMGLSPVLRMMVTPEITIKLVTVGGICFVLTMIFMLLSLLVHPQLLIKLSVLPIAYALIMVGVMLDRTNVFQIFKMMLGAEMENADAVLNSTSSMGSMSLFLHGGVFIAALPLIIAAIVKSVQLNKRATQDFSTFEQATGKILMVTDTRMKMNRIKVYALRLEVSAYHGEAYEVTKEFRVPLHMLHTIKIGQEVSLLINPKKREEVYLQTDYGIL